MPGNGEIDDVFTVAGIKFGPLRRSNQVVDLALEAGFVAAVAAQRFLGIARQRPVTVRTAHEAFESAEAGIVGVRLGAGLPAHSEQISAEPLRRALLGGGE